MSDFSTERPPVNENSGRFGHREITRLSYLAYHVYHEESGILKRYGQLIPSLIVAVTRSSISSERAFDRRRRAIVFTSTRGVQSLNRRRGPSLRDNMVPLNCATNTRRLLLCLRLSAVRVAQENTGGRVRPRERRRGRSAGARKRCRSKGRESSMSRFYRVSRFAVSTGQGERKKKIRGTLAGPRGSTFDDERNSTSDAGRCLRIDSARNYSDR